MRSNRIESTMFYPMSEIVEESMPRSDAQKKPPMTFRSVGGNYQLVINGFDDLPAVLELDEALWALNNIDAGALRLDKNFLAFTDVNSDGKIRSDEIKAAVRFLLANLKTGKGFNTDTLMLDDINTDSPDGKKLLSSAGLILKNLGKPDSDRLTLAELRSDKEIKSRSYNNGDGVVTVDKVHPEEVNSRIELVMNCAGSSVDLSGVAGVDETLLDKFIGDAGCYLDWLAVPEKEAARYLVFGERTGEVYRGFLNVKEDIDNYFLNSETLEFFSGDPERIGRKGLTADLRAPGEVREMLEKSLLALPRADRVLDLASPVNPLLKEKIKSFFSMPECAGLLNDEKLSQESWQKFEQALTPYHSWSAARPECAGVYSAVDRQVLQKSLCDGVNEDLRKLCRDDKNAFSALAGIDVLHKLMLFQCYLGELLNNFVSLNDLFTPETFSAVQTGKLIMDGRHFTLAVPVTDPAEHKRIAAGSNICVIYIELAAAGGAAPPFKNLAVAVTSGNMKNLFVGKHGIFFGADGGFFDARVTAFIEQPVSVSEALAAPFCRFGTFISDQVSKFFNNKSLNAQKEMGNQIAGTGKNTPVQNSSGAPMLLMGSGIGIAALGSSLAFMTRQLQNISIWSVLSLILGIILLFGGPLVVRSLIKLYNRSLSRFLEASGCAVNRRMRLSRKLGALFTFAPALPPGKKLHRPIIGRQAQPGELRNLILTIVGILLFLALCAGVWYMKYREKRDIREVLQSAAAAACEKTPEKTPVKSAVKTVEKTKKK